MRFDFMTSTLRAVWANPWVRRPTLVALAFGGVLIACYFIIDHLGKEEWRKVQAQVAAEGETVDFGQLLAPAIPEEENFCAIGLLRNLAVGDDDKSPAGEEGRRNRQRFRKFFTDFSLDSRTRTTIDQSDPLDLRILAKAMRSAKWPIPKEEDEIGADVTEGFVAWDAFFDELRPALARPGAQWIPAPLDRPRPTPVDGIPHMSTSQKLAERLRLRATAAAAAGDANRAVEYTQILSKLADASNGEPYLVGPLLADLEWGFIIDALWELGRAQAGTAADWEQLERLVAPVNPRASLLRGLRGEMAIQVDLAVFARDHSVGQTEKAFFSPDKMPTNFRLLLIAAPPGLFDAGMAEATSRRLKFQLRRVQDDDLPSLLRVDPAVAQVEAADQQQWWNMPRAYTRWVGLNEMPLLPRIVNRQTRINQAIIACVLERARLAYRRYPPTLDGLTQSDGRPLPLDAYTAQPMHYRTTEEGGYRLWSVGPDGKDDHGLRGSPVKFPHNDSPDYEGDIVWSYFPVPQL